MPDYLKELRTALGDGSLNMIRKELLQRGPPSQAAGVLFGSGQQYGGGQGIRVEDVFTTGYNTMSGQTTVGFVVGFSDVGGEDIVTA